MDWKYGDFLNELSRKYKPISLYVETIRAAGDIPPTLVISPALMHEKLNFKKLHCRLFYAIHFVTINYNVSYHKINL